MSGREFIHNPGPTNIPDRVLEAFRRPAVDFVDPSFVSLVESCFAELPTWFGGAAEVICYVAVGHGAWEGTIVNILEPGETLLLADAGLFSNRWGEMATNLGRRVESVECSMREAPDPEAIGALLAADTEHRIKAVFVCHTETSTGATADIRAIRAAIDAAAHPALYVVDGIASTGTETMHMADWGVDVVLAASQKGMMMPPGLSFCALSPRAVERCHEIDSPRGYWDWRPRMNGEYVYMRFGGTPPEQHMYALRAALDLVAEEGGMDAVVARHARLAQAVREAVGVWSEAGHMELNVLDPERRSNAVTCVRMAPDVDGETFLKVVRERFHVSVGGGMFELAGRAFRMGHLGDLNEPMIIGALGGIEMTFEVMGIPHGRGGVTAATEYLARHPV